ncbi:MAG TPA: EAL domain-containing protein [Candidatus Limnocylindria bacterium]
MVLHGGRSLRTTLTSWPFPLLGAALAAMVALALLAYGGDTGGQLARVLAAMLAMLIAAAGWRAGRGRARSARGWIAIAVGIWLLSEVGRLVATLTGAPPPLGLLGITALGVCAGAIFVTAVRGRMRAVDEAVLYLDAAAVFFGLAGAVLVVGSTVVGDSSGFGLLIHIAFFIGVLAATLVLDLSTRVPLRFIGPWEILFGVGLTAIGYIGLLQPTDGGVAQQVFHAIVGGGVLFAAHGAAHWTDEQDDSPTYAAIAGSLRGLIPLASALLTAGVGVLLITRPAIVSHELRLAMGAALSLVVLAVLARQTLLLVDRERSLGREQRLSDELTVAEAQYRAVVERVPGVVYVAEAGQNGRWHFVSAKIQQLLGYTAEEWTADPMMWMSRMHPGDRDRMILAEAQDRDRPESYGRWEYRLIARDGRVVWVIDDEAVISRDNDGRPAMVQGILVDISDRKRLEDQLRHQALHDPLTGLPNRVLFVDRLSHALVRRGDPGIGMAVLFVDLDDFKVVNDTFGHAVGDDLLRLVGARLTNVIRAEDTVGRLGGDEFAFLLEEATPEDATRAADRILRALAQPFELGTSTATLSASIGVATSERLVHDADPTDTAEELLRDADTAMYAAKAVGNGRVQAFDRRMEEPMNRRRDLRSALVRAIGGDELLLEYQPIVDLDTGAAHGLEALVRWNHPQLGRLLPADFVPIAEESGLIGALGGWVLERACSDLAASQVLVSVNISAHQLATGDLRVRVRDALRSSGLTPSRLLLELTESSMAAAGAGADEELAAIQSLGVRIALDDFGSGYSSLEYLGRLPIDVLKIDRSLVERVHLEPQRQEVLRAINLIAEKLDLETIVEGVERDEERRTLLELGFRQAQGFLFSAAVPLADALDRFEVRRAS